jgi:HNH endonuclease
MKLPPIARFIPRIDVQANGCWLWKGTKDNYGYGRFMFDGKQLTAHRASYLLFVGPLPEGMEPDHLCKNPGCVNFTHLEAVTHRENTLRGNSFSAHNAAKTHCKYGHPFTHENTYNSPSWKNPRWRGCRQCRNTYRIRRKPNVSAA